MSVIDEIAAERKRQIEAEGWSPDHDDGHVSDQMALAAAAYALPGYARQLQALDGGPFLHSIWPWDWSWWKPKDRRRNLIRAAALIVAEIERIDRFAAKRTAVSVATRAPRSVNV